MLGSSQKWFLGGEINCAPTTQNHTLKSSGCYRPRNRVSEGVRSMTKMVRVVLVVIHRVHFVPIQTALFLWFNAIIKIMLSITRFPCYPITHPNKSTTINSRTHSADGQSKTGKKRIRYRYLIMDKLGKSLEELYISLCWMARHFLQTFQFLF